MTLSGMPTSFLYGISPKTLQDNQNLSSFFKILTSTDENNKVYVSTAQAHDYPVTAFQWHPESRTLIAIQLELKLPVFPLRISFCCFPDFQGIIQITYLLLMENRVGVLGDTKKNAFEWGSKMIPHSEDAVQVTQHVANFLISEARKSLNRPPVRKVLDNLIYNYSPACCGKAGKGYDQVYIFTQLQP
ncbi:Gamma-glutamyl hydrolase 1, putative [Theobroma cacao]|uniref:Gamma-glutamyl hydrolase 1, putative n=1 Tax=Theobroma cacao TaxID=3641 RepID=A0A061F7V8_THECC|nr:Gamma-glutamyl hydrolase 1, putative [Theobroma cacao]